MADKTMDRRRKRLLYRCTHRGTKEADLILGGFARAHLPTLSAAELDRFEVLMEESDPDLMAWIGGQENPPDRCDTGLLGLIYKLKQYKLNS